MKTDALLGLLQLADGLFPAGGHAHSLGLESCVQSGRVASAGDLEVFLRGSLEGGAGPGDAVAVVAAMKAAAENDIEAAFALDARLDAFKPAAELREASRQMGYQTLRVAAATTGSAPLLALWAAVEAGRTPGHHAVAFGFACQACGASPTDAAAAYLHSTAALVVGAGVRLLGLGQLQGQRVLAALRPLLARLAAEAAGSSADAMWSFVPGVEIAGMRHASLEARLFRS